MGNPEESLDNLDHSIPATRVPPRSRSSDEALIYLGAYPKLTVAEARKRNLFCPMHDCAHVLWDSGPGSITGQHVCMKCLHEIVEFYGIDELCDTYARIADYFHPDDYTWGQEVFDGFGSNTSAAKFNRAMLVAALIFRKSITDPSELLDGFASGSLTSTDLFLIRRESKADATSGEAVIEHELPTHLG